MRFYDARLVPLAGVQMKFEVRDTNACDPCWSDFQQETAAERARHVASVPEQELQ
jgi:hypothetical protein